MEMNLTVPVEECRREVPDLARVNCGDLPDRVRRLEIDADIVLINDRTNAKVVKVHDGECEFLRTLSGHIRRR